MSNSPENIPEQNKTPEEPKNQNQPLDKEDEGKNKLGSQLETPLDFGKMTDKELQDHLKVIEFTEARIREYENPLSGNFFFVDENQLEHLKELVWKQREDISGEILRRKAGGKIGENKWEIDPSKETGDFEERAKQLEKLLIAKSEKHDSKSDWKLDGEITHLLESVESIEELKQIKNYLDKQGVKYEPSDFDYHFNFLLKYPDTDKIRETYTRFSSKLKEKLDTPQKVRIFARADDFCGGGLSSVLNDILKQLDAGKDYIELRPTGGFGQSAPEMLAYFTQRQVESARKWLLPGLKGCGSKSVEGGSVLYFNFREGGKKEKKK